MKKRCIALLLVLLLAPVAALAQSPMQMPVDTQTLAARLLETVLGTEDPQRRVDLITEAVEIAPDSFDIQILCAQLLYTVGFTPEHRAALDELLERAVMLAETDEQRSETYNVWAEILLMEGRTDEAVKLVRDAAEEDADNEALRTTLATVLYYAAERDEAIDILEELLEDSPQNLDARLFRAAVLLDECQWEEALQAYRQIEKEWPEYQEGVYGQYLTYIASGRFEEGIRALDKILSWGGGDELWLERARIRLWNQYDAEQALTETEALLRMDSQWLDALAARMAALVMLKRYDEAYEVSDEAKKVDPEYAEFMRAIVYMNDDKYEEAEALLQALTERVPTYYNAFGLWAGVALCGQMDTETAAERMREAFAITGGDGDKDLYAQLGQLYIFLGDYHQAALAYSAADMSTYDDPTSLANVAAILRDCGRGEDAQEITREMERRYPGWYETMMARVLTEDALGNAEAALEAFIALREKFPNAYFEGLDGVEAMLTAATGDAQGLDRLLAMAREEEGNTASNWFRVAAASILLGDLGAAQEALDTANALLPEEIEALPNDYDKWNLQIQAYYTEAELRRAQGDLDEALALLAKAAELGWAPGMLLLSESYRDITDTDAFAAMMAKWPDPAEPWDLSEKPKIPE